MNVLLDAHMIGQQETGNETYVINLIRQNRVFQSRGVSLCPLVADLRRLDNAISGAVIDANCTSDLHRFRTSIPNAIRRTQADLLHVTYHAPFWIQIPFVVTIHDTSYRTHPQFQSMRNVILQNVLGYLTILRARLVITDSQFCKSEVQRIYPQFRERIVVTPAAASESWQPQPMQEAQHIWAKLKLKERYLLCVCKFQPRKNLDRLVEAFAQVQTHDNELQLVIAGDHETRTGIRLKHKYQDLIDRHSLVFPGYMSDHDLASLYTGCTAFVFPSLYEGFGLPILEAMACGAPVITSNTTALPEVAGDAALLVDPKCTASVTSAIMKVINDPQLRNQLTESGLRQVRRFNWKTTAERTADAYMESLSRV